MASLVSAILAVFLISTSHGTVTPPTPAVSTTAEAMVALTDAETTVSPPPLSAVTVAEEPNFDDLDYVPGTQSKFRYYFIITRTKRPYERIN